MNDFFANLTEIPKEYIFLEVIAALITAIIIGLFVIYRNKILIPFISWILRILVRLTNKVRTKRSRLESIQIEGATTINRRFKTKIEAIGKKEGYQPSDFYLAKRYKECQWYGIFNSWDIERDAYQNIKKDVSRSFEDEFRRPRIVSLIHGRGGSGKSTLLRRLAVDCLHEEYCVLWIDDKEVTRFHENGIAQLSEYPDIRFLVLIEDWYRIKQSTENAPRIINDLCNHSNVRIVIGDRIVDFTIPREHINNPKENIIELSASENKNTIAKILTKIPDWEITAKTLLNSDNDYKSSLYLILWVIARTSQKEIRAAYDGKIEAESLSGHFQNIVENDLRAIAKDYSGLAKMLYYYGSMYSEQHMYISFDLFIKLADLLETGGFSKLAFTSKEIKPILDIYINKTTEKVSSAGGLPLIAFNHDILADEGLSKVQMTGWRKFDDSIVIQMLPTVIDHGDHFSSSSYLFYAARIIPEENLSSKEISNYIKVLFDKGNTGRYLSLLFSNRVPIDDSEKHQYATAILNGFLRNEKYDPNTVVACLKVKAVEQYASAILSQPKFFELPPDIVATAMKISKDEDVMKRTATVILSQPKFFELPPDIVATAMKISKDEDVMKKAVITMLSQPKFFELPPDIVATAMKISKDEDVMKKAATVILSQLDFYKLPPDIVATAMKISKDEVEKKKAATVILSQPKFFELPPDIVATAMKVSKDEVEKKKAATVILSQPKFFELPHEVVSTAMKISKDEDAKRKAVITILSQLDLFKLPHQIVATAMKVSKDEVEKKKAATVILSQPKFFELPPDIVATAMKVSKDEVEKKKAATVILSQPKFFELPPDIVATAMKVSKDEVEKKKAATVILSQPKFFELPHEVVSTAMKISKDEDAKRKAVITILSQPKFFELPPDIVATAMKISKDENVKKKAAITILSQPNFLELPPDIVALAIRASKDSEKATYFLNNWRNTDWKIVYQSLWRFAESEIRPEFVQEIVKTIINSKHESRVYYFQYTQILKIPFHGMQTWDDECNRIIKNYPGHPNSNASLLNNVLKSVKQY